MAFVALNRYVGMYYSFRMNQVFSRNKCWLMVVGIWAVSFGIMLLPLTKVSFSNWYG